jgi:4'-phosphopantetheinyl transferase
MYWTAKEAFLKGIGKGLSYPLDKFDVVFSDPNSIGCIACPDAQLDTHCWNIFRILPGPNYSGALAADIPGITPKYFEYRLQSPQSLP